MRFSKIIEGKKYMWDGAEHGGESEAAAVAERYRSAGFETKLIEEGQRFYVFTRRVVTEVKVEGTPPV